MELTIPIKGGEQATLEVPDQLSDEQFEHMIDVLQAMRPGLVTPTVDLGPELRPKAAGGVYGPPNIIPGASGRADGRPDI